MIGKFTAEDVVDDAAHCLLVLIGQAEKRGDHHRRQVVTEILQVVELGRAP